MTAPDHRRILLQMVIVYTVIHLLLTLVTFATEHALGVREHLTAVSWAIVSLFGCWLLLRGLSTLYRKRRVRRALLTPLTGVYLQLCLLVLPFAVIAAVVITVGESLHEKSLWALFTLAGVFGAAMSAQGTLIKHFEASGDGA